MKKLRRKKKLRQRESRYFSQTVVISWPALVKMAEKVAETSKLTSSGGILFFPHFERHTTALASSDYDPIGPIFALFPNVKGLHLKYIVSCVPQLLTHFDTLHEILPSLLTSLAVITRYIRVTAGDVPEPGFYPLYDPARLRMQLLTRCPATTKLRFNGPTFNLQWTKFVENHDRYGPGSRVEESHKSWNLIPKAQSQPLALALGGRSDIVGMRYQKMSIEKAQGELSNSTTLWVKSAGYYRGVTIKLA
ncbi:hypothetical protein C8F01DRAFT_1290626 [Mycena amicta]|nr:hypothetical protein C8F01DRAFT_1290626 [Mycena amicta]